MLTLVKSANEEDQLIFQEQIYGKKRFTREKKVWKCMYQGCTATGFTPTEYTQQTAEFTDTATHNHNPQVLL